MFKQSSAAVLGKVYFVARNVREEPAAHAATGRHLSEFTQFDIEWALATVDDAIRLAEDVLKAVSKALADEGSELLGAVGRRKEPVVFEPPFERIPYDDALVMVREMGYDAKWGRELSQEAETAIAEKVGGPVWLTGFPAISRGLLLPTGSGGSEVQPRLQPNTARRVRGGYRRGREGVQVPAGGGEDKVSRRARGDL